MPPDGKELASGSPWSRFLARELGDGLAVARRGQEGVVLLGRGAGHRHEPVRVVGGPVREGPLLHAVGDRVGDDRVEGLEAVDRAPQPPEDRLGQVLPLGHLVEHVLAVDLLAGVLQVVLGGGDPVVGDRLDGVATSGHVAPCRVPVRSAAASSPVARTRPASEEKRRIRPNLQDRAGPSKASPVGDVRNVPERQPVLGCGSTVDDAGRAGEGERCGRVDRARQRPARIPAMSPDPEAPAQMPPSCDPAPARPVVPARRTGPARPRGARPRLRAGVPVTLAVEQPGGTVSRHATVAWPDGHPEAARSHHHAERLLKTLLWARGGSRVHVDGPDGLVAHLRRHYAEEPTGVFDARIAAEIYLRPLEIVRTPTAEMPSSGGATVALGGHLDGCRIGFDLGASDRKVAAVIDGEVVFSEEVAWDPANHADPQWHYDGIDDSLRRAAAHLPARRRDRRQRRRRLRRQPGARRLALPVGAARPVRDPRAGPLRRAPPGVGRRPVRGRQRRRGDRPGRAR